MEDAEKKRVLVIEDEAHIAEGIRLNLSLQGYEVQVAPDGVMGLDMWRSWHPDLIVLDVMLPMIDGFSVLRTIRNEDEKLPVLILSAKSSVEDKVHGLRCGVDDYLAKPFDLDEFLLRVQRLVTRGSWSGRDSDIASSASDGSGKPLKSGMGDGSSELPESYTGDTYRFGENHIDFTTYEAICHGGTIILTEQEAKLLKLFIANKGKPVNRKKLLEAGWGYANDTSTRTLDNFMVRLRKYFEKNPKKPHYFKSRRSIGYVFDHDDG